jgi:hypothetical protein
MTYFSFKNGILTSKTQRLSTNEELSEGDYGFSPSQIRKKLSVKALDTVDY